MKFAPARHLRQAVDPLKYRGALRRQTVHLPFFPGRNIFIYQR